LELPNDAATDNFNLIMYGNKKVIIENHKGITVYENDHIGIRASEQTIIIKGSKFKIEEINDYKVIIKGVINEINLISKG